ncbi:MAG: alpha/beta hydrolase [Flavobacteriaceae bacterium]
MKKIIALLMFAHVSIVSHAQEIVMLPHDNSSGTVWEGAEKEYFSNIWQTQVVTNVSVPTMEVFRPENPNGTAVIIAPGGGLFALSINSEGKEVAQWLNTKGITAFVLKYRLVPTGDDGVKEVSEIGEKIGEKVGPVLPLSIADGLTAVSEVRANAKKYAVDPEKIGFMGFSAGGAVTMGVTFNYTEANRPDFVVPVYPWMVVLGAYEVPADAPPMLVICASDDPLLLAPASIDLYSAWLGLGKVVELHMYAKGGHGFGMKKQGLPSDHWIQRFYDWSLSEGIATAQKP